MRESYVIAKIIIKEVIRYVYLWLLLIFTWPPCESIIQTCIVIHQGKPVNLSIFMQRYFTNQPEIIAREIINLARWAIGTVDYVIINGERISEDEILFSNSLS